MRFTLKRAAAWLTGTALAALAIGGVASATVTSSAPSNFHPITSARVLDTRTVHIPVAAGATYVADLTKALPVTASAVVLNLTVTDATGGGYVLAYPDGANRPNPGSTINFGKGQTVANNVTVAVTDNKVDLYNASSGSVDLVADLEGYYTASAAAPATLTSQTTTAGVIKTGGSAATNATDAVELTLPAGTYQVSVNAKATPIEQLSAGQPSGVQIFPQFFVYNGALNPTPPTGHWWDNDLFNVGSGALESGQNVTIDSYYSGSGLVTVAGPGSEELHIYAFGYDSDRGAGSYTLDDLTVTAVPVTAPPVS